MTAKNRPTDLELAALLSSRICHDVINPVGAIYNGLEILGEEDEANARNYALTVIRNVTEQATARLQFARFAYGASGSAGAMIDLGMAEQVAHGYVGVSQGKHTLKWNGAPGYMAKDQVKLILNLVASAVTALPRGGEIDVTIGGSIETPSFLVRCTGTGARPPQYLSELLEGEDEDLNAMKIQAYYTMRLAEACNMSLDILKDGADILLVSKPAA